MVGRVIGSHGDMIHSRVANNDGFGMMATGKLEERTLPVESAPASSLASPAKIHEAQLYSILPLPAS